MPHSSPTVLIERHWMQRIGWLRGAVLGANGGIVATTSQTLVAAAAER
jgi:VIT1/CCC1 family predicted Fe2+/Mn2+ transporter